VVKLASGTSDLSTGYGNYHSAAGPQLPEGHFIILASANCSLLIKSLAVCELIMPADFPPIEQQSQDYLENMSAVLDKVYEHSLRSCGFAFFTISLYLFQSA